MESRPLHISINLYKVSNVYKKKSDLKKKIPGAGVQLSQPVPSFLWGLVARTKETQKRRTSQERPTTPCGGHGGRVRQIRGQGKLHQEVNKKLHESLSTTLLRFAMWANAVWKQNLTYQCLESHGKWQGKHLL